MQGKKFRTVKTIVVLLFLLPGAGCTSISIAPSCPIELEIGESGAVWANELYPGAIPSYQWEVLPAEAGTFADATATVTTFTAAKAGEATIRLTAADGLYQVVSQCTTRVGMSSDVAVLLSVDPDPPVVLEPAIIVCTSVGGVESTTMSLLQLAGPSVSLTPVSPGVISFTPQQTGDLTFQCVGTSSAGQQSLPTTLTVTVQASDGNGNDNGGRGGRG